MNFPAEFQPITRLSLFRSQSSSEANLLGADAYSYRERRKPLSSKYGGSQISLTSRKSRMHGAIFNQVL